jgi:hypothetical protein
MWDIQRDVWTWIKLNASLLSVIEIEKMLEGLKKSNELLELIQKVFYLTNF